MFFILKKDNNNYNMKSYESKLNDTIYKKIENEWNADLPNLSQSYFLNKLMSTWKI